MKKSVLFGSLMLLASSMMAQNTIDNAFFDKVKFRGAFGSTNWATGWTNFDPQNAVYPATERTINAGNITADSLLGSPLTAAAKFSHAALANPFFTKVDYIGAFGKTDWTAGWANFDPQSTTYPATTVTVAAGDITTNTTWTKGNVYLLNGWVYVKNGATLTIEAGTIIRGDKTNKGALIVEKGSKLIANGTAAEPIVFTSNQPAGSRTYGDWGGVILCGQAPINPAGGSATIEGGVGSTYGGTDAADNSGSLQYVRIEFPGIAFAPNNEINGLTMGGVGSGTTIDNIQVSYSGDDSYEWFGGTVNCKHLIALRGWDDDFDTDFGYSGMVQFGVALRDPAVADQSKSNSFESDNDASGSTNSPFTSAVFSNMSSFGPLVTSSTSINALYQAGMHLRRNTKLKIFNSVFAGWPKGLIVDGALSQTSAANGDLVLNNVVLSGMTTNFAPTAPWLAADEQAWFETSAFDNKTYANNNSLAVSDPFNLTAPKFTTVQSYLLNGWVYVKNGATLTIKPGVVIRGDKTNKGALIVEKGGKLIADGTATEPIVFTSNQPAGSRTYGDWGGVILCGQAPINPAGGSATIEGGVGSTYGGTNAADNSGSLKVVRIEFPGIAFAPNNEINGLTMGGVGSGTTIDSIQVSYSGDDSYEWFGGTVNCKHLIALRGWDDDFDTDFGYSGMVQYAVALRDPAVADQSKSNSFESDNDASGSSNSPFTSAIFSNVSSFGPLVTPSTSINALYQSAMHIRRNSKLKIYNAVFAGWPSGLQIDGNTTTQVNANNGEVTVQNSVLSGMTKSFVVPSGSTWTVDTERTWYNNYVLKNDTVAANTDLNITNPFSLTAPNFTPTTSSKMNELSYWHFQPTQGLTNNMVLYLKAYANGSQVTTPGSTIMVYKNGECRGSDEVMPDGTFQVLAMSDLTSESDLELQLYDRATSKLYYLPTVFDFESDSEIGTISTQATVTATASLTIPLVKGTNWISFNVLPENNSTKNVLNYTLANSDVITRQGGGTATYSTASGNWIGAVSTLSKNMMYKLKCKATTPGSVSIVNQALTANSPITLTAGVNWLGYSPVEAASISTVLAGYTATAGDKVTSNAAPAMTATYTGSSWSTSRPTMSPGKGYTLKSAAGGTFSFPKRVLSNSTPNRVRENNFLERAKAQTATIWSEPQGKANNMTVYAKVYKDNVEYMPDGLLLGVFKQNDSYCYGVSDWFLDGSNKIFLFGAQDDPVTADGYMFKVYDPTTGVIYDTVDIPDDADDLFTFVADGELGAFDAPLILKISNIATSVREKIESKFNATVKASDKILFVSFDALQESNIDITLNDLQGRVVGQLLKGNSNGQQLRYDYSGLAAGLYIVKAQIGGVTVTRKVVLR